MITVHLRSPNINIPNSLTSASLGETATFFELKLHLLARGTDSKIPLGSIKLIHAGRVCDDSSIIFETFKGTEGTVHLVACRDSIDEVNQYMQTHWSNMLDTASISDNAAEEPEQGPVISSLEQEYVPENSSASPREPSPVKYVYQLVTINEKPYMLQVPFVPEHLAHTLPEHEKNASFPNVLNIVQNRAPQATPAPPAPAPDRPQRPALQFLRNEEVWLTLKLAFIVWIFTQGADWWRYVMVHLAAMVYFLVQTGRVRAIRVRVDEQNPEQNNNQEQNAAVGEQNAQESEGEEPEQQQREYPAWIQAIKAFVVSLIPQIDADVAAAIAAAEEAEAREAQERDFAL